MPEAALRATTAVPAAPAAQLHALTASESSVAPAAPTPRLQIPEYDLATALVLERELGVSHAMAQVLVRRGLAEPGSARAFLDPGESHDPSAFRGIEQAVSIIDCHVRAGGRITVHGDYDVDGVCATAILVRALRELGANVGWFLPSRLEDGYGLASATVERLAQRGTRLLITVDCGITAVQEVDAARAAGVDVVVSDHHTPRADGVLPDCPIVHPRVCEYPCTDLCGTGVALKLAQALGAAGTVAEDVELVALATVADLVPLQGENRRLVRDGLSTMANTRKLGLRALMTLARVDPSALDARALGFRLAPRINASGRLARPDAGLELLLTEDDDRAVEIAAELEAVNAERRAVEQRIGWEAETLASQLGERSAFVLAGEGWHPGVIGIVASRIVERYHRPAILIALDGEAPAQGSGRSIPGFDLLGALDAASAHLLRYGGHRAAAGLSVKRDCIGPLRAAIEDYAQRTLTLELLQPLERVDAIVAGSELGLPLAEELALLEPCGIGNPGPRLLVPGARFGELRPMGEGRHLRFSVSSGGARARAVSFGCDGRIVGEPGDPLDATFRLELSSWNGAVEPRLVLRHAEPCAPSEVEVLGEPAQYLDGVFDELDAAGEQPRSAVVQEHRIVLDRRGESPLAVLADAAACGGVLAVCADVPRRLRGLSARAGGFALIAHHTLGREPSVSERFAHIVVLDPPSSVAAEELLSRGSGFTHLAWGEAELRFVEQMHELEYGLRTSLVALYRSLKLPGRATGQELERLLRGDGPHARPARLAGRLIRVLAELELVSLDRDLPALSIGSRAQTALDCSPAYRVYAQRHEDGRRFLSSANLRRSG